MLLVNKTGAAVPFEGRHPNPPGPHRERSPPADRRPRTDHGRRRFAAAGPLPAATVARLRDELALMLPGQPTLDVELMAVDGSALTVEQAGQVLGISPSSVDRRIRRGRPTRG